MGKKYSYSIAISACVIIVVSLIIFLALSFKDSNSKDPDRERTPNAIEVITAPEQLGVGPTKVINTSQVNSKSDVSKLSESYDPNGTPAEIIVKEIEKNIRLESNPDR